MQLEVNSIDEAKLKRVSAAMEEFHKAMEDLHECKCEVVSAIRPDTAGNNGRVMIMTHLHPEYAAPILWQALGQVQTIIKATRPPTNVVQ